MELRIKKKETFYVLDQKKNCRVFSLTTFLIVPPSDTKSINVWSGGIFSNLSLYC